MQGRGFAPEHLNRFSQHPQRDSIVFLRGWFRKNSCLRTRFFAHLIHFFKAKNAFDRNHVPKTRADIRKMGNLIEELDRLPCSSDVFRKQAADGIRKL